MGCGVRALRCGAATLAVALAAGCATAPRAPDPIAQGLTQDLAVVTDPPGASCTIAQGATVLAAVAATPATVAVRRVSQRSLATLFRSEPPLDPAVPVEITCRKDGHLDIRMPLSVARALEVAREEKPPPERSPAQAAGGAVLFTAGAAGLEVGAYALAYAAPPVALALAAGILAARVANAAGSPPTAEYAYRPVPELVLVPASFPSEAARDACLASLAAHANAERDARRARVDAQCRYFPCTADDPQPCHDPVCERQRALADEQLARELARVDDARASASIVPEARD